MRQTKTTVIGLIAVILGGAGFVWLWEVVTNSGGFQTLWTHHPLYAMDRVLAVITKLVLAGAGMLILRRSRWAVTALVVATLMSVADSVMMLMWFLPPIPESLSEAGRAGRRVGHFASTIVPPLLYLWVIQYLNRPITRQEFAGTTTEPQAWTSSSNS